MRPEAAAFGDVVALWYVGERTGADVVRAACDLLVAGIGGTAVAVLAGVQFRNADDEVPGVLTGALVELGLPAHDRGSPAADLAGLRTMAARVAAGTTAPAAFAHWALSTFDGHGIAEAQPFVAASGEYEFRTAIETTTTDLDDRVTADVRRLLAG